MRRNFFYWASIVLALTAFFACAESEEKGKKGEGGGHPEPEGDPTTEMVHQIDVKGIIQSLPSPVEMAALIKSGGVPFSRNYLASPEDIDDFETNFRKALGLGILSADLGYLNVYEKNSEIVNYLASIRRVSDDLSVGQFFDFHTLRKIAANADNLDSLIFLSQTSFRDMDNHLRKMNRSHLSALMVTGVWIEGLYLVTQIVKADNGNEGLKETIGQQKATLEMLNKVVQSYKGLDKDFAKLAEDMDKLKNVYDQVVIEETEGKVETIYVDDLPVVTTTGKSILKMTEEQLAAIIHLTEDIRDKLVMI